MKYLSGLWRVINNTSEDGDDYDLETVCFVTIRNNSFQHSDMCELVRFHADFGGFYNRFTKDKDEMFFGESISCRVCSVKEFTDKRLHPMLEAGSIWSVKTGNTQRQGIWVFVKEGSRPYFPDFEFKQLTREEFMAEVAAEAERLKYVY